MQGPGRGSCGESGGLEKPSETPGPPPVPTDCIPSAASLRFWDTCGSVPHRCPDGGEKQTRRYRYSRAVCAARPSLHHDEAVPFRAVRGQLPGEDRTRTRSC